MTKIFYNYLFKKMKFFNLLLFFFLLSSIYLCQETNNIKQDMSGDGSNSTENLDGQNQQEVFGELRKLREENNKKFKEKINEYLKELKLENKKKISREEFKKIFFKLFDFGEQEVMNDAIKEEKKDDKKVEIQSNKEYKEKLFNNLVKEKQKEIEVDKILRYFEPAKVLFALKDTLNVIGLDSSVDSLSDTLMDALNSFDEKNKKKGNEKNTDL